MAPWSSGQDASLSRWNQGFDSPWSHFLISVRRRFCGYFFAMKYFVLRVSFLQNMVYNKKRQNL